MKDWNNIFYFLFPFFSLPKTKFQASLQEEYPSDGYPTLRKKKASSFIKNPLDYNFVLL